MDLQGIYFQLFNDNLVDFIGNFFYIKSYYLYVITYVRYLFWKIEEKS